MNNALQNNKNDISAKPIIGFQTAQGSMYRFHQETNTAERFKVSHGPGQGKQSDQHICFFVTDEQKDYLKKNYFYQNNRYRYRFGYKQNDKHNLLSGNDGRIPEGAEHHLYIYDRETEKYPLAVPMKLLTPALGLTPVEKGYYYDEESGERMGSTHIGNPVVKIYENEGEFLHDLKLARAKFNQAPSP